MACFHSGPGSFSDDSWEAPKVGKQDLFNCMISTHLLIISCHSHAPYILQVRLMRVQGKWVNVAVSEKQKCGGDSLHFL